MNILLLNAGSSSLKCTLVEADNGKVIADSLADWAGSAVRYQYTGRDGKQTTEQVYWRGHAEAVGRVLHDLMHVQPAALRNQASLAAVGHRVVHGGPFSSSVRITPEVRSRINALADLAPLHNPPSLATLAAAEAELPGVPHVAVFDTAFHATMAPETWTYPIPHEWTRDWGIRRYGFHGLSHAYCSRRAAEMLGRPADEMRLVICHLGNGCSASAVRGGRCVDTTMGFTPLEGLMMGTRSGSIDPSIVLHVQQRHGLTAAQVDAALNHDSGLLGVSGISGDMRQVLEAARSGKSPSKNNFPICAESEEERGGIFENALSPPRSSSDSAQIEQGSYFSTDANQKAQLALAVYTHRVRQAIGALAVTMGGVDALVFTAGVGEHAGQVREAICVGLECLGLELDVQANAACRPDADVARAGSRGRILVIATREDVTMLREVIQVLAE